MTTSLLRAEGLAIHFGGVKAVNGVSFDVQAGEVFTLIGPNGAGKTTLFNLISRLYRPTAGRLHFAGQDITALPSHRVAALGIARTFQNIELFEHASVLQNLLIARHAHRASSLWQELLYLPVVKRTELQFRRDVEEVIDFLGLQLHQIGRAHV